MASIERSPHFQNKSNTQSQITKELLEGFLYGRKKPLLVNVQTTNGKRKWEDGEDESSRKLQSLWCAECCKHIHGECPVHRASQPKITYAVGSFPPEVRLCTSNIPEYLYGACAAKRMPQGTWIGPYEGRRVTQIPKDQDNAYVWEIYENGQFSHFLDGTDENVSSWMRFIRCARHKAEQNMSVVQYGKNIYYCATRDIEIGEEMLVWYHESYYQFWGVPLVLPNEPDEKNGPPVPASIPETLRLENPKMPSANQTNYSPVFNSAQPMTSPQSCKPTNSLESHTIPQQYAAQKAFQFPQQMPATSITSKRCSPPSKLPYPPVLPTAVPDSSVSPVAHHPSQGSLPYPPGSPVQRPYLPPKVPVPYSPSSSVPYPSKGSIPYSPLSKGTTPYPPPSRHTLHYSPVPHQSAPYEYLPQARYPPTPIDAVRYHPPTTQYEAIPSTSQPPFLKRQIPNTHTVIPPTNVQISPLTKSPPSSTFFRERSPSTIERENSQIPKRLSSEVKIPQEPSSHSLRKNQQTTTRIPDADQELISHSPQGQPVKRYYETESYTSSCALTVDRSSTEAEHWTTAEVKENMPLRGTRNSAVMDDQYKSTKHQQALKPSALQNLTPSIHNNSSAVELAEKQHNQVTSTMKTTKEQEISWKCGQCGEMFAQQVTLRLHVCPKAPENPFHCGHCSRTFSTPTELREHVVTHSNDRPFKCGFCARSFAGATTLGNHMRTHTGQRPYECKVCGQTFAIATQLSRHLKPPGECGLMQKEAGVYNQNVDIAVEQ